MFKRIIRSNIAKILNCIGVIALFEKRMKKSITILCYHRILPEEVKENVNFPDLAVTPESFEMHCKTLSKYYNVFTLRDGVSLIKRGYNEKKPIAVITFDDGYRDNYIFAKPILEKYGLKATFFVISGLIGKAKIPWYDHLFYLLNTLKSDKRRERILCQYLTNCNEKKITEFNDYSILQMIKEMDIKSRGELIIELERLDENRCKYSDADLIMTHDELLQLIHKGHEIGAHTITHEILTGADNESVKKEITECKEKLEQITGTIVQSFCYPNGNYNREILSLVKNAGYQFACTTKSGNNTIEDNPHELRRWFIKEEKLLNNCGKATSSLLRLELTGFADKIFFRNRKRK